MPSRFDRVVFISGLVVALTALVACSERPLPPWRERLARAVGCYELVGALSAQRERGPLARFALRAESVSVQRPRLHRVDQLVPSDSPIEPLRLWSVDSASDTIAVSIGDGLSSQFFRGVPSGDTALMGITGSAGDVGPPYVVGVHAARARRISCTGG